MSKQVVFDFSEQMKVGKKGELLLKRRWPKALKKLEGKGPDFIDIDGDLLEIKTDTYDMTKSGNFFFENFSVLNTKALGGPWQAHSKGSTVFIYLFLTNKVWFIFRDIPALLAHLGPADEQKNLVYIRNRGYTTTGIKVKRDSLKHLCEEIKL